MHTTEKQLKNIETQIEEIRKQIAPLDTKLNELYKEKEKVIEKINKNKIQKSQKSKKPDWNWILEDNDDGEMTKFYYAEKELGKINLSSCGYFPETKQRSIKISLIKGDPISLKNTIKGLKIILPYIKERREEVKGYKCFSILEHTLSQNGIYNLIVGKNDCKLHFTKYGKVEILKTFKKLDEALIYIQENHYYEIKE